jgi:hypothetical protein
MTTAMVEMTCVPQLLEHIVVAEARLVVSFTTSVFAWNGQIAYCW